MTDTTLSQQQAPEVSEININDIFDFYMTGETSITKSLGYGSLGAVFQATRRTQDASTNIAIKPFSCTKTLFEEISKCANQTDVFQNSKNVLQFKIKQLAENGDHIATVFEMELCQKSLFQYITEIKEGKAAPTRAEILAYIIQALNGLNELQEKGIGHYNLKPHNVLIDSEDTVKISDSSFSIELSQKMYNKPQQYNRFLSMNYLSPEYMSVVDGKKDVVVDAASDVFSLGVVFLELIGQDINIVTSIKLKSGMFDSIKVSEVFEDLGKLVCENMLCTLPKDRKTVGELIEMFSEIFFHEITKFSVTSVVQTGDVVSEVKEEVTETVEEKTELVQETAIKVEDEEKEQESDDEVEKEEVRTPVNEQFSDSEYEILQEDQEVEVTTNNRQASAKKPDNNDEPSQESTLDQEAIEAECPTQESERVIEAEQENVQEITEEKTVVEQTEEVNTANVEISEKVEEVVTEKVEEVLTQNIEVDTETLKRTKQISRIERLRLDFCSKTLTEERVTKLFKELQVFTSLTHLTLALVNTQVDDSCVVVLSEFLTKFTSLTSLTLRLEENKLTPNSLTTLNTVLSKFTNLTTFVISFGKQPEWECTEKTWETETVNLVEVLKAWTTLKRLSVSLTGVKVSNVLVEAFSSYLNEHQTLNALTLDFETTDITEEVTTEFIKLVESYTNLTTVDLPFGKEVVEQTIEVKVEEIVEHTTEQVVEQTTEQVVEQTTEEVVEQTTEEVVEQTIEAVVEQTTEEVVEQTTEEVVEQTTEEVVEQTTEEVVEQTIEAVVEQTTEVKVEVVEQTAEEAVEQTTEEVVEQTTEEVVEQNTEVKVEEVVEQTTEEVVEQVAEEVEQTTEEVVEQTTEVIEQKVEQVIEEQVEVVDEKVEEVTKAEEITETEEVAEQKVEEVAQEETTEEC